MVPTRSLEHPHYKSAVSFVLHCSVFQSCGVKILLAQSPWHSQFFGNQGPQNCQYQHDHQVYRLFCEPAPANYIYASSPHLGLSVRLQPKSLRSSQKDCHLTSSFLPLFPALFANLSQIGTFWAIVPQGLFWVVKQSLKCFPDESLLVTIKPSQKLARRRDCSIF